MLDIQPINASGQLPYESIKELRPQSTAAMFGVDVKLADQQIATTSSCLAFRTTGFGARRHRILRNETPRSLTGRLRPQAHRRCPPTRRSHDCPVRMAVVPGVLAPEQSPAGASAY